MSSRNGQLPFSPEEVQQPKRGIVQQVCEEDAKQTYVIIIKQENDRGKLEEVATTGSLTVLNQSASRQSLDSIRKNLTNIEDDEYDSGISAANLFLKDDELEDVEEAEGLVLPSAKRTRIHEDPPPSIPVSIAGGEVFCAKGVVKRNLFFDDLSPITPPAGSVYTNIVTSASPDLLPGNTASASGSVNTPTPSLDYKTHPAVRKIILVSPNQCQASPNVSTPNSATAVKALYTNSPLASSTPITADSGFNVSTTSPDSGISLSVSSLSTSNILTPPSQEVSAQLVSSSTPGHDLLPASVTTVQSGPGLPIETKITFCRRPSAKLERRESEQSDDGSGDKSLDTSLANIQWLGGFQLGEKPPSHKIGPPTVATRWTSEERGRRKEYNQEEIIRVNRECGRVKRPPYSYMVLIQMALQSRSDQKMTLREICKWIEDTFSFYKYTAKPGWKNSIRHNLSYYQCFVRTSEDKKKHGARWTLKFDDEKFENSNSNREKITLGCVPTGSQIPGMIPLFVNQSTPGVFSPSIVPVQTPATTSKQQLFPFQACIRRKRTGPMPILPRPSPVQAYALVPLHSVPQQQAVPQAQPLIYHIPQSQQSQLTGDSAQQNTPIPIACAPPSKRSEKSILPNVKPATACQPGVNILRQAWLNADVSEDENGMLTSILKEQGISVSAGQTESKSTNKQEMVSSNQGLPKPKIYAPKSKKRTRSRVKKLAKVQEEKELLAESSDSETDDQFEKGLPTPLRQLFQSPDEKSKPERVTTSTPVRNAALSPDHLPSPIRGWTPLRGSGAFDGSFLDILQEEAVHALKLLGSPQGADGQKSGRSPNTSLTEFGIFQISPDKGNANLSDCQLQGLSRIFADFDPNFMTDGDGIPVDITNFNWSGLQQTSPKDDDKT